MCQTPEASHGQSTSQLNIVSQSPQALFFQSHFLGQLLKRAHPCLPLCPFGTQLSFIPLLQSKWKITKPAVVDHGINRYSLQTFGKLEILSFLRITKYAWNIFMQKHFFKRNRIRMKGKCIVITLSSIAKAIQNFLNIFRYLPQLSLIASLVGQI